MRWSLTPLGVLALLVLLALGFNSFAADSDPGVVQRAAGLETGNFSEFTRTHTDNGALSVEAGSAYGGQYRARANYFGGEASNGGGARTAFAVDWGLGDEIWYGAAYYLPPGFRSRLQTNVEIVGWDSDYGASGARDYGGLWVGPARNGFLFGGNEDGASLLAGPVALPEGRWFFVEVRQRLSTSDPLNEIYVDGELRASARARNYFGRRASQVRYGFVRADQQQPSELWFDRAVAHRTAPGGPCAFWIGADPGQAVGEFLGSYAVTAKHESGWPIACWRPFAATSPFNQHLDGPARLHPLSTEIVENLVAIGAVTRGRAGIADTSQDYGHPTYFASAHDPLYTVRGGSTEDEYAVNGETVRMPVEARPARGSDRHLTIVYDGYEYGFWDARIDAAARTISISAGRKVPIAGEGTNAAGTAARFPNLAGQIRFQELEAGIINHALFATSDSLAGGGEYVYPAGKGSSNNPLRLADGWPIMGMRLRLDPSYATDAWLAQFPTWKRAVLRALRDYGAYFGDDSGAPLTITSFESGTSYTSFGLEDPFEAYARQHVGEDISESGGIYYFDIDSRVDWSKLQVVDPCVAERTC